VITCVARLLFASWMAPELIHNPKNSLLSPLSCDVYNILDVQVVHCRHSSENCLALSACVSARDDEFKLTPTRNTSGKVHTCGTRIGTTVWPWCLATTDPLEAGDRPGRKSRRTLRSRPGGGQPHLPGVPQALRHDDDD
jgi:hypothetical protein